MIQILVHGFIHQFKNNNVLVNLNDVVLNKKIIKNNLIKIYLDIIKSIKL
jgi:hypothetical protein